MKKVGIVTFTTGDNFGQRLQNLALQQMLCSLNCNAYTIRKYDFRLSKKYWIKKYLKSLFDRDTRAYILRHKCFTEFDNRFIRYYDTIIASDNVPKTLTSNFNAFIAGSDQIWNPNSADVDDFNFLTFANDNQKFSYAASLATDKIPNDKVEEYCQRLSGFKKISLRENNLEETIRELTGAEVCTVLDPTLLIQPQEWSKYENRPSWYKREKYIFKYFLGRENSEQILKFAKDKGLTVIDAMDMKSESYVSGPSEFLFLIHNAEYVITDSFHGVIFSLIFKKRFALVRRQDSIMSMESRFTTLFDCLGLSIESTNIEALMKGFIPDYMGKVKENMQRAREKSLHFLEDIVAQIDDGEN